MTVPRPSRDAWVRAAMIAPFVAGAVLLTLGPAAATVAISLTRWSGLSDPNWNGLSNFATLADDPAFGRALRGSLLFAAVVVPLKVALALGFALLLGRRGPASAVARVAVFAPTVVPATAVGLAAIWLLNPVYGPLPVGLGALGLPSPRFLTTTGGVRTAVIGLAALQFGEAFLVALAVRAAIGERTYEVAAVEGAGAWRRLTSITLPLMAPALVLLCARETIVALTAGFVPALIVGERAPRAATASLPSLLYETGFRYLRFGDAAAVAVVTLALAAVAVAVQLALLRRIAPWVDLAGR